MYKPLIKAFATYFCSIALCFADSLEDCKGIEDRSERFSCYDRIETNQAYEKTDVQTPIDDSPIKARQKLERSQQSNWFSITPHRPNYILPASYNANADYSRYGAFGEQFNETEIKFQLSLKSVVWSDLVGGSSVGMAFTQVSFWQLYADDEASAPFRETNYEPEIFWQMPVTFDFMGVEGRYFTLALNHQSNGRAEPFSRSWNRITGELVFEYGRFVWGLKSWYRIKESREDDNNPNIEDFMGRIQIGGAYQFGDQTLAMAITNNLKSSDNRGGVELNWSTPIAHHLKLFVQAYSGYGENMIDQEIYTNRIGVGFALTDWL